MSENALPKRNNSPLTLQVPGWNALANYSQVLCLFIGKNHRRPQQDKGYPVRGKLGTFWWVSSRQPPGERLIDWKGNDSSWNDKKRFKSREIGFLGDISLMITDAAMNGSDREKANK
jgi:hypothetical protein